MMENATTASESGIDAQTPSAPKNGGKMIKKSYHEQHFTCYCNPNSHPYTATRLEIGHHHEIKAHKEITRKENSHSYRCQIHNFWAKCTEHRYDMTRTKKNRQRRTQDLFQPL